MWIVESMRFHGPNVMICKLVASNQRTLLTREYLPPSTLDHLPKFMEALDRFLGRDPVILGELNADKGRLRNPWYQQVADFLAYFRLVDLLDNFLQCLRYRNLQTWWQVRQGRILQIQCDYYLGSEGRICETIGIRYQQKNLSNHFPL